MGIACFIRYQIDPFQRAAFQEYAAAWGRIIPRCGGHLIGYFLPHEGTNYIAWGIIQFKSLADYESYRGRLLQDDEGKRNFEWAHAQRFIVGEERSFLKVVDGTFNVLFESTGIGPSMPRDAYPSTTKGHVDLPAQKQDESGASVQSGHPRLDLGLP